MTRVRDLLFAGPGDYRLTTPNNVLLNRVLRRQDQPRTVKGMTGRQIEVSGMISQAQIPSTDFHRFAHLLPLQHNRDAEQNRGPDRVLREIHLTSLAAPPTLGGVSRIDIP